MSAYFSFDSSTSNSSFESFKQEEETDRNIEALDLHGYCSESIKKMETHPTVCFSSQQIQQDKNKARAVSVNVHLSHAEEIMQDKNMGNPTRKYMKELQNDNKENTKQKSSHEIKVSIDEAVPMKHFGKDESATSTLDSMKKQMILKPFAENAMNTKLGKMYHSGKLQLNQMVAKNICASDFYENDEIDKTKFASVTDANLKPNDKQMSEVLQKRLQALKLSNNSNEVKTTPVVKPKVSSGSANSNTKIQVYAGPLSLAVLQDALPRRFVPSFKQKKTDKKAIIYTPDLYENKCAKPKPTDKQMNAVLPKRLERLKFSNIWNEMKTTRVGKPKTSSDAGKFNTNIKLYNGPVLQGAIQRRSLPSFKQKKTDKKTSICAPDFYKNKENKSAKPKPKDKQMTAVLPKRLESLKFSNIWNEVKTTPVGKPKTLPDAGKSITNLKLSLAVAQGAIPRQSVTTFKSMKPKRDRNSGVVTPGYQSIKTIKASNDKKIDENAVSSKGFTCMQCGSNFSIKLLLDAHKRGSHGEKATKPSTATVTKPIHYCKYCDKKFALLRALHIHLMEKCTKILPTERRKLKLTEMEDIPKAQLSAECRERNDKAILIFDRASNETRKKNAIYLCDICKINFNGIIEYIDHRIEVHSKI